MIIKLYIPAKVADSWEPGEGNVLNRTLLKLVDRYGGYTLTSGRGAWKAPAGNVVEEAVHVVEVVTPRLSGREDLGFIKTLMADILDSGETEVLATFNHSALSLGRDGEYAWL